MRNSPVAAPCCRDDKEKVNSHWLEIAGSLEITKLSSLRRDSGLLTFSERVMAWLYVLLALQILEYTSTEYGVRKYDYVAFDGGWMQGYHLQ